MNFERFGKYLLLEKLASGGMAEVYLAKIFEQGINKFVALKRILPQFSESQEFIDMFKEEAKIAANLRHSNIVSIHFFGYENDQLFLVMDFVEGQNLRQILNSLKKENRNLSIEQIIYIIKEVAAALDYAHRALDDTTGRPLNVIHRDMSPQNIMISFEGEVKIVDFGIAKAENQVEQTQVGTIKGKYSYMSPEQAEGAQLDARTDIFSVGILLWELLSKERLFVGPNEAVTLKKVRDCQIPSLRKVDPNIPGELERITIKALSKDLSLRYQTASSLHNDLNRFLNIHYPEFSKQEFSRFMKSLFHEMFVENRKKLKEFSQISVASDDNEDTSTETATLSELSNLTFSNNFIPGLDSKEKNSPNNKIDLNHLKVEKNPHFPFSTNTKVNISGPNPNHTNHGQSTTNFGKSTTQASSVYHTKKSQITNSIQNLVMVIGLGIVGSIGYYFWNKNTQEKKPTLTKNQIPIQGTLEIASQQPTPISIQSRPSGAFIEVDGKQIGITPYIGSLPSGQPLKIIIKREGFVPFEKIETLKGEPHRIEAVMQAEPPKGYISLEIFSAPADTVVLVNGLRIEDKSQLKLYAVPARVPVEIHAFSPFNNTSAKTKVTVDINQKRNVRLSLTRKK